jgi:hypothetical protein
MKKRRGSERQRRPEGGDGVGNHLAAARDISGGAWTMMIKRKRKASSTSQ